MKPLFAAIQFLTIIPFPKTFVSGEKELARSMPYFPVVGLLIGLIIAVFDHVMNLILPPQRPAKFKPALPLLFPDMTVR